MHKWLRVYLDHSYTSPPGNSVSTGTTPDSILTRDGAVKTLSNSPAQIKCQRILKQGSNANSSNRPEFTGSNLAARQKWWESAEQFAVWVGALVPFSNGILAAVHPCTPSTPQSCNEAIMKKKPGESLSLFKTLPNNPSFARSAHATPPDACALTCRAL